MLSRYPYPRTYIVIKNIYQISRIVKVKLNKHLPVSVVKTIDQCLTTTTLKNDSVNFSVNKLDSFQHKNNSRDKFDAAIKSDNEIFKQYMHVHLLLKPFKKTNISY